MFLGKKHEDVQGISSKEYMENGTVHRAQIIGLTPSKIYNNEKNYLHRAKKNLLETKLRKGSILL